MAHSVESVETGAVTTAELSADHPGVADPAYRRRRAEIAAAAIGLQPGEPARHIDYTDAENETWAAAAKALTDLSGFEPNLEAIIDFEPDLVVVGPRGEIVARDGTPLDPDKPIGPYAVCPGGETVTITDP